jgi:putative transposase
MQKMAVLFHTIWSTKYRIPFLNSPELREKVWSHMKENALTKKIGIDTVGGYRDHCHCLISLTAGQRLGTVVRLIKGESSYWINKNRICSSAFAWQEEYYSVRLSNEDDVERVRSYIRRQEEHHKGVAFESEVLSFEEGLQG